MNKYELLLILPGTLDEREAEAASGNIVDLIKEQGEGVEKQVLGKNRLAYPIKQIRYGYFYTIIFSAESKNLARLQEKLRLHAKVLRFMISHFNIELSNEQKVAYTQGGAERAAEVVEETIEKVARKTSGESAEQKIITPKEEKKVDMEEVKKKLDKILDETDMIAGV